MYTHKTEEREVSIGLRLWALMEDSAPWRSVWELHSRYWQVGSGSLDGMVLSLKLHSQFFSACHNFSYIWLRTACYFAVLLVRIIPGLGRGPWSPGSSNRGGGGGSAFVRCLETNPKFFLWWSGCTVANGPPRLLNPSGSAFHSISIAPLVFDLPAVLTLSLKGQTCFCLVYPRCRGQPVLNMLNL